MVYDYSIIYLPSSSIFVLLKFSLLKLSNLFSAPSIRKALVTLKQTKAMCYVYEFNHQFNTPCIR